MNSQFSTGFVIALVIGIAVGAFWPKYGAGLSDAALGRDQDAREVSLARANGQQGGCGGSCEESHKGSVGQCAGNNKSGRGQGGRGCDGGCEESRNLSATRGAGRGMGRGQGGRGCSGDCEESGDKLAARGAGRGMGRHGRATLVSTVTEGRRERHAGNTNFAKTETCQESGGRCTAKPGCSENPGGADCEKTLTANRRSCNAADEDHGRCASKSEAQAPEQGQRGRDRDIEHSTEQHRGPGFGLGLGLGRGWGREFMETDAAASEDDAQAEAND